MGIGIGGLLWGGVALTNVLLGHAAPAAAQEPKPAAAQAQDEASFEELRRLAAPLGDLATGLRAPESVESCDKEPSEREQARCRVVRRYLQKSLPRQPYRKISEDPQAIALSDYDGNIKGYHLALAGCLSCSRPLPVGPGGEARLVTVGIPDDSVKGSLPEALSLSRNAVSFNDLPEAKQWLTNNKNDLRAEFVFLPVHEPWTRGKEQGVSLAKVGVRVFNRCTGEVFVSQPPSRRPVDVPKDTPGCDGPGTHRTNSTGEGDPGRRQLSRSEIADAMDKIRGAVSACYSQFHQRGKVDLAFVASPTGVVQSVTAQGAFSGTPTGDCAANAAKSARFPPFEGQNQDFVYPFFLR